MRDFFHGWRRKAGVISLVTACVLMGLWFRSRHMRDSLQVRVADNVAYLFISNESELVWQSLRHEPTETIQLRRFAVMKRTVSENRNYLYDRRRSVTTKEDYLHSVSFKTIGGSWTVNDAKLAAWKIPDWCVVLPLTLLSGYLILWKPRRQACAN